MITEAMVERLKMARLAEMERVEEEGPNYGGDLAEYNLVGVDEKTGEVDKATIEVMFAISSFVGKMQETGELEGKYRDVAIFTFGMKRWLQYQEIQSFLAETHGLTLFEYYCFDHWLKCDDHEDVCVKLGGAPFERHDDSKFSGGVA